MKPSSLFDLRYHSSLDLDRLSMAIETGLAQCGDHKDLQELKVTLTSYKLIIKSARLIALERESEQFASQAIQDISNGIM